MIFVFNGNGDLLNKVPEKVYQGSNKASRIFFFAPISADSFINVAFTLPNGELRPKRLMSLLKDGQAFDGLKIDGQNVACWVYDLPRAITTYAGKVTVQFSATNNEETISTENAEFFVEKGVPPIEPADDDNSYDYIIEVVSQIITEINNLNQAVSSFKLLFDENFPNSISENTYKDIHEAFSNGNKQVVLMGKSLNNENIYGYIYKYSASILPLVEEVEEIGQSYMYSIYLTINGIGYQSSFEYYKYNEGKGTSYVYVNIPLEKFPTELEKTIPNIKVVKLANFPDNFGFEDSQYLGDIMSGIDYETSGFTTPPDAIIIKNNRGVKGVVVSYEPDEFPRATVVVGNYIYTYILNGIEDPNIGWFSKQEIGGGGGTDVQINGTSIVENGVANIPVASANLGLVKETTNGQQGILIRADGTIATSPATTTQVNTKNSAYKPLVPSHIDNIVKAGLIDNKNILDPEEQQGIQKWLGIKKLYKHCLSLTNDGATHNISLYALSRSETAIPITDTTTLNKLFEGAVGIDTNEEKLVVLDQITQIGDGYTALFWTTDGTGSLQFEINTTISVGTTVITEI